MAIDYPKSSSGPGPAFPQVATALNKEILEAYERIGRSWLNRMQSEVDLWSDLTKRLSSTSSTSEAVETYTKWISQRMQMAVEDAQRLLNDSQEIMQKFGHTLSNGLPKGST